MPISVALQNIYSQKKEQIVPDARDVVINDFIPFEDPTYPMLQYIDEYSSTIFNVSQMRGFLVEWDRLVQTLTDPKQREVALEIRRLAEKCQKNPQTYLCFNGD